MVDPTPLKLADPCPDHEVLDLLNEAISRAIAGKTTAIAIVEVHNSGAVSMAYSHCTQYHQLNSGAARLAARLATEPGDQ